LDAWCLITDPLGATTSTTRLLSCDQTLDLASSIKPAARLLVFFLGLATQKTPKIHHKAENIKTWELSLFSEKPR
jgi:hypothetical protein